MQTAIAIVSAPRALDILRERFEDAPVLSAYLDTGPGRTDGPAWVFALRDGSKAIREGIGADDDFESAVRCAEEFLGADFKPTHPGLALFTTAHLGGYAVNLPYAPVEGVVWTTGARIEPLVATLDDFERIGVVLIDKEDARLYTIFLGEIDSRQSIEDYVPGRQATGGWFGLAQARYARHHEDHVRRHINRTIDALMDLHRDHPFDRLLIGGPEEAVSLFRRRLPSTLRARVAGSLSLPLFASEHEILDAATALAQEIERDHELELVREILEAEGLRHAALGVEATLAALGDERVHELILTDSFDLEGAECETCQRLAAPGTRCPWCGGATIPVTDLQEAIVRRALDHGVTIEVVHGQAATELDERGGIAAWTRY